MKNSIKDRTSKRDNTMRIFNNNWLKQPANRVAVAMEIREENNDIVAELVFADGNSLCIQWTNIEERKKYIDMINGYTLIYDRRQKRQFNDWKK